MELVLDEDDFTNGNFFVAYDGDKQAQFTIIDETFEGNNNLGRINAVTCAVRETLPSGELRMFRATTLAIGVGDNIVGVRSATVELRGKQLTRENMASCVITLYESDEETT